MSLPSAMQPFLSRRTVAEAWSWIDSHASWLPAEWVPIDGSAGRVLAGEVISPVAVPGFVRAMMDGYAVRAADTEGASAYNRLPLRLVGEVRPGQAPTVSVGPQEAVRIATGAPLPPGADAVLPVEWAAEFAEYLEAMATVTPGRHTSPVGEDISAGQILFQRGRRLRPQDLGVLASVGIGQLSVVRRPTVRILVTGDELLPAGSRPEGYRIVDANGVMLAALVERDGGLIIDRRLIPDDPAVVWEAMRQPADVVLISGGSSVGHLDYAPRLLREHGELAIHGVAMRPSSPAGMGRLDGRFVFLLPGNPVSCLCAYDFFAGRAIRLLGGRSAAWPYRSIRGVLARKLSSVIGRVDYARVRITPQGIEPVAISGASLLSSTTVADGFVVIEADSEGYPEGSEVEVFLYDI